MVNVKVIIPIIIIIIIAASLIIFTSNEETTKNEIEEKWVESGPFSVNKAQYNVGEKIFFDTDGLKFDDKGMVEFLRPINDTHHKAYIKIPFDGIDAQPTAVNPSSFALDIATPAGRSLNENVGFTESFFM